MATTAAPPPQPPDAPLRVIVADDDPLARRVVRDALQTAGIVVVAEAADGREVIELALYYRPEVVLMDVVMPGIDGIEATRRLTAAAAEVRVVIFTTSDDDDLGLLCLRAGAAGFLTKDVALTALPRALRGAAAGEAVVSRRLAGRLVESLRRVREDGAGLRPVRSRLSAREWEVLDLLCEGSSTDQIADALVLSVETVRSHLKSLMRKLDVHSREQAVAAAQRMRLEMVQPEPRR